MNTWLCYNIMLECKRCHGKLIVLETFCTDAYQQSIEWYRDIKKRCVCSECGLEQDVVVDTVKQDKWFK